MSIQHQPGAPIMDGGDWMHRPAESSGVPPGLEYLALVDNIRVIQKKEMLEIALGWESNNKYVIVNGAGQQIYYAYEEADCCSRQFCGPNRGFVLHIVDNFGKEVMRINRDLNICAGCAWCATPNSCCAHLVTVEAPPGHPIGSVSQRSSACIPAFVVQDMDLNPVLDVESPDMCTLACGCGDKSFTVRTNSGHEVGEIRKQWSGLLQEAFTDADNFGVSFPMDLSVRVKAGLIAATFLIDFMFFETKSDR